MASPAIQPAAVVTSVILTQEEMVPEPASAVRAPRTVHRWWAIPLAVIGLAAAAAPVVFSFTPSTLFIEKPRCREYDAAQPPNCTKPTSEAMEFALVPASAEPVEPRMTITGAPTFDSSGQIYFVTITQPNISMVDWFVTRHNPAARLQSHRDKYGDQSQAQLIQAGQQQMRSAKDNAMYVALKAAGYPVEIKPGDVIIDYLLCLEPNADGTKCLEYSPADELLDPGDVLKKVNGVDVNIIDDLPAALKGVQPGTMIDVEFERAGEPMSGQIETILSPGEDPPRTIIGFRPIDSTTVALPEGLDVDIDTESIGGPSAGLAFTLTLIDELTEGDLMGGQRVAVTGTIDVEGKVGAIGGLNSKASAVKQVGVKYFLVPTSQDQQGPNDNVAAARKVVGDDVEIIPVATVEEALAALERIGGDPVKLVNPPSATDN
jgi:PDZ domain-containing protein